MATPATGARASRRAAANAARQNAAKSPTVPEVLADVVEPDVSDDEVEAAFGPADVAPAKTAAGSPRNAVEAAPAPDPTNSPSDPVRADKIHGGALAMPMEDLTRKIDVGDLVIPKLRLSQAMSKTNTLFTTSRGTDGVQMGNWYNTATSKDLGQTVYFIPVDMRKSRAYFVQGQGLMCRSFDLRTGEGDPGGPCEGTVEEQLTKPADQRGCPLRLWDDRTPPKCGITYNYPGLVVTNVEEPDKGEIFQVILQLRSASTAAAKAINTMVMNEGGGVWHNVVIELGVQTKSNPKGTFFVPTVDFYDTTDAPEFSRIARRAASMARQMGGRDLRRDIEDDEAA